jgi:predicted SnoaL-like aldol condensation-catalyzing enzyme
LIAVEWRVAAKNDRQLLERFSCAEAGGPDYEQLVQRYFRTRAVSHMSAPNSLRSDHRLLLVFDSGELVAAACHRLRATPDERNFVFAAVELSKQGMSLGNGERASDVLWNVVANDMLDRSESVQLTVFARVHPDNRRSLKFCERIGLRATQPDSYGLIICIGTVARP